CTAEQLEFQLGGLCHGLHGKDLVRAIAPNREDGKISFAEFRSYLRTPVSALPCGLDDSETEGTEDFFRYDSHGFDFPSSPSKSANPEFFPKKAVNPGCAPQVTGGLTFVRELVKGLQYAFFSSMKGAATISA
ncbi:unnamed protein product, partial [Polarella glacialis]